MTKHTPYEDAEDNYEDPVDYVDDNIDDPLNRPEGESNDDEDDDDDGGRQLLPRRCVPVRAQC